MMRFLSSLAFEDTASLLSLKRQVKGPGLPADEEEDERRWPGDEMVTSKLKMR